MADAWTIVIGLCGAVVVGIASVLYPVQALAAVMYIGAALLAMRFPDIVLGVGVFACLGAGDFGILNQAGQAILVFGGIASLLRLISRRTGFTVGVLIAPLMLVGWLGVRLALGSGFETIRPLVACLGALLLANACTVEKRPWARVLAWAALAFVFVSWRYGSVDATGLRFAGISSNPNRMVMGVLVAIPLLIQAALSKSSVPVTRIVMTCGIAVSIHLIISSGSDQGGAGLLVIVLLLGVALTRRFSVVSVWTVFAFGLAAGAIVLVGSSTAQSLSPDLLTLSGRTYLYQAGWEEFLQHPFIGSGQIHVSQGLTVGRSTHNSIIGIAAATGLFGGLVWLAFLTLGLRGAMTQIRSGLFCGAAAVGVVVSQLVQSVEFVPLTWAILLLAAWQVFGAGPDDA